MSRSLRRWTFPIRFRNGFRSGRIPISLVSALAGTIPSYGQIVLSGFMSNPASTDSPYEYIQLVATEAIDFSATPYTVVAANNGIVGSAGWATGGAVTRAFELTSGQVVRGETFYVGGSGRTVNGSGSASLASLNWIRYFDTTTTAGDGGIGNTAPTANGFLGTGGTSADGLAVFQGIGITAASVPVDAVFYGTGVGTAYNAGTGAGYRVPATDRYAGSGFFGAAGNTYIFADPGGGAGAFARLTGTYDTDTGDWRVARSLSVIQGPASAAAIASTISVVPEIPSSVIGAGVALGFAVVRRFGIRNPRRW